MEIKLVRNPSDEACTIGALSVDGTFFCDTLEDVVREEKIPGRTAIPAGRYRVVIDHSQHFNRELPHVLDVPNFVGIRIHAGNSQFDTEGCILVGQWQKGDSIINSRATLNTLIAMIEMVIEEWKEEVWITVEGTT